MKRLPSVLTTAAACIALLAAIPSAGALAAGSGPGAQATSTASTSTQVPDRTYGKIIELAPDHAILQTRNSGNVRIKLGIATRFVAHSYVAAHDGLQQGNFALATGGDDRDPAVARRFEWGKEDFGQGAGKNTRFEATVVALNGRNLQLLQQGHDPVVVRLTDQTRYLVNGKPVSQQPDFKAGQIVRMLVHREVDLSLDALTVNLISKQSNGLGIVGTVIGAHGDNLTIKQKDNDAVDIKLTVSTKYIVNAVRVSARPAFAAGEPVKALVRREPDDSLDGLVISLTTTP